MPRVEATYDYANESGELVYQVLRMPGKKFRQRRPDDHGGWIYDLDGVDRLLYHLPEVIAQAAAGGVIWKCEGEKDADRARSLGRTATCNSGGAAARWLPRFTENLQGARGVVIVADKDKAGMKHAAQVAASLAGVAPFRIVQAAVGKDLSDHLDAGLALAQLDQIDLSELDLRPTPTPLRPRPAFRRDPTHDALKSIDTETYVLMLTGQELDRHGFTPCPLPNHADSADDGGSFHAHSGTRWKCFGCDEGGDIYELAEKLWGHAPFPELRLRLVDVVMRGGVHA